MSPLENGIATSKEYKVVAWDLDTTGRRLIDEICQIAGHFAAGEEKSSFSQYVMPYKNPNPGARRSFGIKVAVVGRYRMLKDVDSGRVLKTKSEISALQDFIAWLKEARGKADGLILVYHEPSRKVLVPLLLEALTKYNLTDSFSDVVTGFVNSVEVVDKLADSNKVTSNSLRSLCKTLLDNTSPATCSALDRSRLLTDILARVLEGDDAGAGSGPRCLAQFARTVSAELSEVRQLKAVLGTQGTLRPIFEARLRQKRPVRERAIALRKMLAEAGLDYESLKACTARAGLDTLLRDKVPAAADDDLDELTDLVEKHFGLADDSSDEAAVVAKDPPKAVKSAKPRKSD